MKNTLFLMGRGVEGTGNTRISIELFEYFASVGNAKIVANSEKKWGRQNMQVHSIEMHNFSKAEYTDETHYDTVVIMSVPAKNYTATGMENFTRYIEKVHSEGTKVVYLQVDHSIHSISRNYYRLEEFTERLFDNVDQILTHCLDNDFCMKFLPRHYPKRQIQITPIVLISTDFDAIEKGSFENRVDKSIRFIGRSAGWKGWPTLVQWHHKSLKDKDYACQVEGIEMSIGVLPELFKEIKPVKIPKDEVVLMHDKNIDNHIDSRGIGAQIYGPFIRNEALSRMGKTMFAAFFTYLGPNRSGMLENTFLECLSTKTVTVIRKEAYDTVVFNDGTNMRDYTPEEMGLVIYDDADTSKAEELMEVLNTNKELYEQYANTAYEFFKSRFDRSCIGKIVYDAVY